MNHVYYIIYIINDVQCYITLYVYVNVNVNIDVNLKVNVDIHINMNTNININLTINIDINARACNHTHVLGKVAIDADLPQPLGVLGRRGWQESRHSAQVFRDVADVVRWPHLQQARAIRLAISRRLGARLRGGEREEAAERDRGGAAEAHAAGE